MSDDVLVQQLTDEIRAIYTADPTRASQAIEAHLILRLADRGDAGRPVVERIMQRLSPKGVPAETIGDAEVLTRIFGLLLGRKVHPEDLSSAELLERLAHSLNTIFDTLNELINVINTTFSAGTRKEEQTIRQFIGYHLEGEDQTQSLEDYLGQIGKAFLTTQEAFKKAARMKVAQILQTLDPDKIATERSGGLKIGPLRKAEDFDILKEKIEKIRRWFDSGRFMEDFLREFERNCESLSMK
ncbi:hypothetical protein [Desulfatitalea tepidiphila]|uniref:hypothetical protein n=1 Tax=Desulfatitalea tepidiphila TaxID=1185843 RepID=UPI0006B501BF|nr:hypothetical protein [Desulfatitalea tepidiphila]